MSTGQDLINALKAKDSVRSVDNCPGASVAIGRAVYGKIPDDNKEKTLNRASSKTAIQTAIYFEGRKEKTAIWHFMTDPVHHFVVIPWHKDYRQVYTLFMAYEGQYTIHQYVQSAPGQMNQALRMGFKDVWTQAELCTMLYDLLNTAGAWSDYFRSGTNNQVNSIKYYKYDIISLAKAIGNVG